MDFMDSQDLRAEEGKEQWEGEEMGVWGQGCDVTGGEEETGDSSSTAAQLVEKATIRLNATSWIAQAIVFCSVTEIHDLCLVKVSSRTVSSLILKH